MNKQWNTEMKSLYNFHVTVHSRHVYSLIKINVYAGWKLKNRCHVVTAVAYFLHPLQIKIILWYPYCRMAVCLQYWWWSLNFQDISFTAPNGANHSTGIFDNLKVSLVNPNYGLYINGSVNEGISNAVLNSSISRQFVNPFTLYMIAKGLSDEVHI